MPLLEIKNLNISFSGDKLVRGVSLRLEKGKTLCLVGESGSGKSLTALSIMGLLPHNLLSKADKLVFDGEELQGLSSKKRRLLRGLRIGMVFQEPLSALNPVMRVGDQIAEVFKVHTKLNKKDRIARVLDMFNKVQLPEPEHMYGAYPHQLSGGQRQRAMIAIALAMEPNLLIADEPTTALDATVQGEILALMQKLQKDLDTAILFITHDFGVVKHMANDIAIMEKGKIVEKGSAKQILKTPKKAYTKRLLAAAPTLDTSPKPNVKGDILLNVKELSKTYTSGGRLTGSKRKVEAIKNVSFTLKKGQTVGIVGESGSGKSTLAKCILQLEKPDCGNVILNGQDLTKLNGRQLKKAWREVQTVFQDPFASLNPRRKAGDSIAEGLKAHRISSKKERAKHVTELLKAVGMEPAMAERYPHSFSGGQRQRIGIARALALNPSLVIADEAVAALDVSVQAQVLALMEDLKKKFGLSYLFISHDLRVVSQIADWVLVMHNGEVVEQGPTHKVLGNPEKSYTKELIESLV